MADKPVVQYSKSSPWTHIKKGTRAYVEAINHPRLGHTIVHTSEVQSYDKKTGIFETLNSIYQPQEGKS